MQFTNLSDKYSTAIADPTTNLIFYFEPCYHFTSNNNYFETGRSVVPYLVNVSSNVILALVTTVANTLVLLAIRKNTSLHLPSKLLLGNLVVTDLGAGIVAQPMLVAFFVPKAKGITASILACVSLLTITAIS